MENGNHLVFGQSGLNVVKHVIVECGLDHGRELAQLLVLALVEKTV